MVKCSECKLEFITLSRMEKHFNKAHRHNPDHHGGAYDVSDDGGE